MTYPLDSVAQNSLNSQKSYRDKAMLWFNFTKILVYPTRQQVLTTKLNSLAPYLNLIHLFFPNRYNPYCYKDRKHNSK